MVSIFWFLFCLSTYLFLLWLLGLENKSLSFIVYQNSFILLLQRVFRIINVLFKLKTYDYNWKPYIYICTYVSKADFQDFWCTKPITWYSFTVWQDKIFIFTIRTLCKLRIKNDFLNILHFKGLWVYLNLFLLRIY